MSTRCLSSGLELTEHFPRVIDSSQHTWELDEIALSLYRVAKHEFQRGRMRPGVQGCHLFRVAGNETPSDSRVNLGICGGYFIVLSTLSNPSTLSKEGGQYSPGG